MKSNYNTVYARSNVNATFCSVANKLKTERSRRGKCALFLSGRQGDSKIITTRNTYRLAVSFGGQYCCLRSGVVRDNSRSTSRRV